MTIAQGILVVVGLLSGLVLIGALLWSIVRPSKRIWPPNREHSVIPIIAWGLTLAVFGAVIGLGIVDWKSASMPNALRWAVGPFLIAIGNLIAWVGGIHHWTESHQWGERRADHFGSLPFLSESAVSCRHGHPNRFGSSLRLTLGLACRHRWSCRAGPCPARRRAMAVRTIRHQVSQLLR